MTSSENNKEKFYLEQLDVFRALAALSVCAVHFSYNSIFHLYFKQALFVQFFFTLSGFVIYLNYHNQSFELIEIKKFMTKRFKRLYPLHFFFLISFGIIEIIKYFLFTNYGIEANNKVFEINNLSNFILHLIFLQHYADSYSFNGPAWSISVEMLLYLFFSIMIFIDKKYSIILPLIFILVFFVFLVDSFGKGYSHGAFFSGLYSFSIGCVVCNIYLRNRKLLRGKVFDIIYFIFLFFFLAELFVYKILLELDCSFFYSVLFGLIIYFSCFLNKQLYLYRIIFNSFFIYLGKISYSIYLGHLLIFYLLNNFLRFILNYPTQETSTGKVFLKLNSLEANLFTLLAYLLTIIFASFTYKYIEKKFYKKLN